MQHAPHPSRHGIGSSALSFRIKSKSDVSLCQSNLSFFVAGWHLHSFITIVFTLNNPNFEIPNPKLCIESPFSEYELS